MIANRSTAWVGAMHADCPLKRTRRELICLSRRKDSGILQWIRTACWYFAPCPLRVCLYWLWIWRFWSCEYRGCCGCCGCYGYQIILGINLLLSWSTHIIFTTLRHSRCFERIMNCLNCFQELGCIKNWHLGRPLVFQSVPVNARW